MNTTRKSPYCANPYVMVSARRTVFLAFGYRNIRSLLWENRVFSSWDFFSSRCFCASSKRFTCRSVSRSNGFLSTGWLAFSFAFSFIVFVCRLISDSARVDSWSQGADREIFSPEFNVNACKMWISSGINYIWVHLEKKHDGGVMPTLCLVTFSAISKSFRESCETSSFSTSPFFFPSRRSYCSGKKPWNTGK